MSSKHYASLFSRSRTARSHHKLPKTTLQAGQGPRLLQTPPRRQATASRGTPLREASTASRPSRSPERSSSPSQSITSHVPTTENNTGTDKENRAPVTPRIRRRGALEGHDNDRYVEGEEEDEEDGGPDPKRCKTRHVKDTILSMQADLSGRKVSEGLEMWHIAARGTARQVTMFPQANAAFAHGLDIDNSDELDDTESTNDANQEDVVEYKYQCDEYLKLMPHLKDDIDSLLLDPAALILYGKYINARASSARGDDIGNLNKYIMKYIARVPELAKWPQGGVPHEVPKNERGWMNVIFGLLLCPQDRLRKFMQDPDKFCLDVRTAAEIITADDFPMYLYDQTMVKDDDPLAGLFRGPLLLLIIKSLYTGPKSALSGIEDRSSGRPPWVVTYNVNRMEPRLIVYAAVLARHMLSSQATWSRRDIDFVLPVFYQRLLEAFKLDSFSRETLAWYDMEVFGKTRRTQDGAANTQPRAESLAARIAARVAADTSNA